MIDKRYYEAIESRGWSVCSDDDDGIELEKSSPAGEDFIFYSDTSDFPAGAIGYARCFDPDEHAAELIENRGKYGIPDSVRTLIDNADAIKEMLTQLADALDEARADIESSDECEEDNQDV